ncbi:hypothetical protein D3C80_2124120 [compost metagenome]
MTTSLVADGVTRSGEVLLLSTDGQVAVSRNNGERFSTVPGLSAVSAAASIVPLDDGKSFVIGSGRGLSQQTLR